jgi:UDP-N-acetylmuramate--alanine ligase
MIEYSQVRKLHFVGIGGAGMCGIAEVLHNMGFTVSGSDMAENDSVKRLKRMGIKVFLGHNKENVAAIETLVYSSAIKQDNVEIREARAQKIPVISRAEMLAELMRLKFSIAVAGTHGKTTTTSMIACVLAEAKKDPTYVVGGKLKTEETGAKLGKSDYLVAEADESDGSFLQLFPTLAVITNIEDDHLDFYQDMDHLREAFRTFANKVPFYGAVVLNLECPESAGILPHLNKRVLTYGFGPDSFVQAENVSTSVFLTTFDLVIGGEQVSQFKLNIGGMHNVANALAAITVLREIGVDVEIIRSGMEKFYLPDRRMQTLFYNHDFLVVDDYAHHPTEIMATVRTLRSGDFNRIILVFQPHRFTRLELLMDKFADSFNGVDQLIISRLYAASQSEIKNINSVALVEKIKERGFKNVQYIEAFNDIQNYLLEEMKKGDAIAFCSAGDLSQMAHGFAHKMEELYK